MHSNFVVLIVFFFFFTRFISENKLKKEKGLWHYVAKLYLIA